MTGAGKILDEHRIPCWTRNIESTSKEKESTFESSGQKKPLTQKETIWRSRLKNLVKNYNPLYAGQEATVRIGHGTTDWVQIGKGVHQGYILSSCLFNLYAEYIMRNARLEEAQAGIKISRRDNNNLRYAHLHHPYGRKWRRTKELLDDSERREQKSWFKAQHSEN